jgi:phenylalanyl-tRNA synthetase alpha subunit
LTEAGYNPSQVGGFAFGFGVERMAMLNLKIDNISDLWKEPYLPRI